MFRHILVPVDFTPKNAGAISVATKLGRRNSEVTLLHIIETIENIPIEEMKEFYGELDRKARRDMAKLEKTAAQSGRRVNSKVLYGKRVEEIVRFVMEKSVDLIVMSSHRPNPDNPARDFGTISHRVAILSPCAVLLVK